MSLLVKPGSPKGHLEANYLKRHSPTLSLLCLSLPPSLLLVSFSLSLSFTFFLSSFIHHFHSIYHLLKISSQGLAAFHGFRYTRLTSPIKEDEELSNDLINDKNHPGLWSCFNFLQHILGVEWDGREEKKGAKI